MGRGCQTGAGTILSRPLLHPDSRQSLSIAVLAIVVALRPFYTRTLYTFAHNRDRSLTLVRRLVYGAMWLVGVREGGWVEGDKVWKWIVLGGGGRVVWGGVGVCSSSWLAMVVQYKDASSPRSSSYATLPCPSHMRPSVP